MNHLKTAALLACTVLLFKGLQLTNNQPAEAAPQLLEKWKPNESNRFKLNVIEAISDDTRETTTVRQWDYHYQLMANKSLLITVGETSTQKYVYGITYRGDEVLECKLLRIGNIK